MLVGLSLVGGPFCWVGCNRGHVLEVVSDELLEKDQRHESTGCFDAVIFDDLVLLFALFDEVRDQTLSVFVEAALLILEFALLSQNIHVPQRILVLSNLILKSERNELHLFIGEDLSGLVFGVDHLP